MFVFSSFLTSNSLNISFLNASWTVSKTFLNINLSSLNLISALVGWILTSIFSGYTSINSIKNGNLLTVLKDLKAFSTATTKVLFFMYLPLTKILWLFLEPLAITSFPI